MKELIPYDSIEKKNDLEREMFSPLSPEESLIHCLNVMDFMAALRSGMARTESGNIDWIVLERKNDF